MAAWAMDESQETVEKKPGPAAAVVPPGHLEDWT